MTECRYITNTKITLEFAVFLACESAKNRTGNPKYPASDVLHSPDLVTHKSAHWLCAVCHCCC